MAEQSHLSSGKGIRARRTEQVLSPEGSYVYGGDQVLGLIQSAQLLLARAGAERTPRDGDNFLTTFGPSAILLAVTAFESFLNEVLDTCLRTLDDPTGEFESLVRGDRLTVKFSRIPELVTGLSITNADVELAQHVRNEIVHYYPRHVGTETNIPEWLQLLAERNLLYSIGIGKQDIGWQQKIQSYQLSRWCAATVGRAALQFADAVSGLGRNGRATMIGSVAPGMAQNFRSLII